MPDLQQVSGWSEIPLSTAVKIQTGFAKGALKAKGRIVRRPYLRAANVQDGHLDLSDVAEIDVPESLCDRCELRSGDVLIVEASGNAAKVGCGWKWSGEIDACLHQNHVFALRPDAEVLLSDYLSAVVTSSRWKSHFRSGSGKSTSLASINTKQIRAIKLSVPPVEEQRAIVRVLACANRTIDCSQLLLKARIRLKRGLMQQLLTGQRRFPEFRKQPWREVAIGDILQEIKRPIELEANKQYRLVSVRRRSGGLFDREIRLGADIGYPVLERLRAGDFVIARRQVLHGAMAIVPPTLDGTYVSNAYAILRPRDESVLHLPFFNFISQQQRLYHMAFRCSYGVAIEKMFFRLDWFFKERLHIPPTVGEQEKIASVLASADDEIDQLRHLMNAIKEQKKGLMQRLLTGKVRVPPSMLKRVASRGGG